MKLERWGIQGKAAPLDIAPGTLLSGATADMPWIGMLVEDGDGKAIVLLSDFAVSRPAVFDLHQLTGPWHLIDGTVVVCPIDEAESYRMQSTRPGKPGGLIIGESGELGIVARYVQGVREVPLLYSLETGRRWQVAAGDRVVAGWRLEIVPPGRTRSIPLASFPREETTKT